MLHAYESEPARGYRNSQSLLLHAYCDVAQLLGSPKHDSNHGWQAAAALVYLLM